MCRNTRETLLLLICCLFTSTATLAWISQDPMLVARSEATAVEYDGQLYVINGFARNLQPATSIEKYNPSTKKWSHVGTTSVAKQNAVTHNGVVLVGNEVWIIGGRIGAHPGKVSDKVWIYNFNKKSWRQGPKLPIPMAGGGAAMVNQTLHVFGGMDKNAFCDVNYHFTYDLNNTGAGWKNITASAAMPSARNHFSTVVINKVIYAIGGQHGHDRCPSRPGGNVALVHSYTPATNSWKRLADLPAIESHNEPSTFVHNGFIYTVGGATAGTKVLRFDPARNQWEHIIDLPVRLLAPVSRIYEGKLLVAGGGAPRTALTVNTVRTIAHNKFNDTATAYSLSTGSTATTQAQTENEHAGGQLETGGITEGAIVVEAELYSSKVGAGSHAWVILNSSTAHRGLAVQSMPNTGVLKRSSTGSPKISYRVRFPESGTYYLWVRGGGDDNSNVHGSNDSVHAGLNGSIAASADKIDGFPIGWNWSNHTRDGERASIYVPSAGVHSVDFWMREDGFSMDKFLLTKQSNYTPGSSASTDSGVGANDNAASNSSTTTNTDTGVSANTNASTDTNANTAVGTGTSLNEELSTGSYSYNADGIVSIEVENFKDSTINATHRWVSSNLPNASGSSSMISSPNTGAIKGNASGNIMLSYSVEFASAGTHYVWVRGWGDENSKGQGHNDSVHVGINGALSNSADKIDGFPTQWHWSRRTRDGHFASVSVPSSGRHTINLWMREDGFAADKIVLTKNILYMPTGIGPASTASSGEQSGNSVPTASVNKAPIVEAGTNAMIMLSSSHSLSGSIRDDNLPSGVISAKWTKQSGPGSVSFSNASSPKTDVTFSTPGGYVLKLTASDSVLSHSDSVSVIVEADHVTEAPETGNIDNIIAIEAEHYSSRFSTATHQWVKSTLPNASGGQSMVTTPNSASLKQNASDSPSMSYTVNFPKAGSYHVWIRGWGDENAKGMGNNDSVHAGLNGTMSSTADKIDGFPAGWHWSKRTRDGKNATLTVPSAGPHSVNLWMREDGLAVDKIILTLNADYVPSGNGPAVGVVNVTNADNSNNNNNTGASSSNDASNTSDSNYIADAYTAWEIVQTSDGSKVVARHETGAVAIDEKLYVLGGRGKKPVQAYDTLSKKWKTYANPPVEMHHFQPVAIGKKIYVIGAMKDSRFPIEAALEFVYEFDTTHHTWRRGPSIPANRLRGSMGAAVYNGKIYLVGGNTKGHSGPSVRWFDEYDPTTQKWRVMPDAPHARDHSTIAIVDNKLVVAAGRRSAHPNTIGDTEAKTDVFNFKTARWENTADPIPTQRAGTMVVAVGNEVVVIGGESWATVQGHTDVEALNVKTGKWRKLQPLITGRHSGGAAVISENIHVITGNSTRGGGNESTSHEILKLD